MPHRHTQKPRSCGVFVSLAVYIHIERSAVCKTANQPSKPPPFCATLLWGRLGQGSEPAVLQPCLPFTYTSSAQVYVYGAS